MVTAIMDGEEEVRENRSRTGSVKAAIHMFGEKMMLEANSSSSPIRKPYQKINFFQKQPSKARELDLVRQSISDLNENRRATESNALAEMQLMRAKKTVKALASQIEVLTSRAKKDQNELQNLNDMSKRKVLEDQEAEYDEARKELELLKGELSKISVEIELVKEESRRAHEEGDISSAKKESYLTMVESLRKEIEEANEEQVLVELATIEALKELAVIETERKDETNKYSSFVEAMRMKMYDMVDELNGAEEIKEKLAEVESDINMLQIQIASLKEMDQFGRNKSLENSGVNLQELFLQWKSITEELEEGKKELALVRRDGFEIMTMMDVIRREKFSIVDEIVKLKRYSEKADKTIKTLNSKLIRARKKLETVSVAEEKNKGILLSFTTTLDQLKKDKEAKNEEKNLLMEETESFNLETKRIESETGLAEEKLQVKFQELEKLGSSELEALEKLKCLTEDVMREREAASQHKSTITISKFEYEYLCGCAAVAQKTADKKVEAAEKWIIALKASERQARGQIEMLKSEISDLSLKEEEEIYEKSLSSKDLVQDEVQNQRRLGRMSSEVDDGKMTPSRRGKMRRSITSPASKHMSPRSTSFTVKRKRKVMPVIAKYFANMNLDRSSSFDQV